MSKYLNVNVCSTYTLMSNPENGQQFLTSEYLQYTMHIAHRTICWAKQIQHHQARISFVHFEQFHSWDRIKCLFLRFSMHFSEFFFRPSLGETIIILWEAIWCTRGYGLTRGRKLFQPFSGFEYGIKFGFLVLSVSSQIEWNLSFSGIFGNISKISGSGTKI